VSPFPCPLRWRTLKPSRMPRDNSSTVAKANRTSTALLQAASSLVIAICSEAMSNRASGFPSGLSRGAEKRHKIRGSSIFILSSPCYPASFLHGDPSRICAGLQDIRLGSCSRNGVRYNRLPKQIPKYGIVLIRELHQPPVGVTSIAQWVCGVNLEAISAQLSAVSG